MVVVVGLVVGAMAWLMERGTYDTWAAIPVAAALLLVSAPLLRRAARFETDVRVARLLWWALGLKLVASLARHWVAFQLYDGTADANMYHRTGAEIARQLRDGYFAIELGRPVQGTGFIQLLTGWIYTATGPTSYGGFLIFAWLGFWGLYLFYRAFVRACPQGDHWRYARLGLLLPSLLFWPSSIGKEAWMCLGLGVMAYGAARLFTHAQGGLVTVAAGGLMLVMVRPHVAALLSVGIFAAFLLRRPPSGASIMAPLGKLAVILVLGVGLVVAVGQMEAFFGVDDFNRETVEITLEEVQRQTGQGGSRFVEHDTTNLSPSRFPEAFVNVMFRPFPWQAVNLQSLLAAAESMFLLILVLASWRRIVGSIRSALSTPYVLMCCVYTVLFVYGFSAFANAGILVRQRVQVLPFFLVLLCLPALRAGPRGWRELLAPEPVAEPVAERAGEPAARRREHLSAR